MKHTNLRALGLAAIAVFVLDQASKLLVLRGLRLTEVGDIAVLPPFLHFRLAWNRGVNFGLMSSGSDVMRWILVAIAIGVAIWVVVWIVRGGGGLAAHIAAGLLVGGAFGNVTDRLAHGAVVDFLNMSCCGLHNPFSFNIADVGVFLGAVGLIAFAGKKKKAA